MSSSSSAIEILLNLKSAQAIVALNGFISHAKQGFAEIALAAGVGFGLEFLRRISETNGELLRLAETLNVGVAEMAGLKFAADRADVSFESLQKGIKHFSDEMVKNGRGSESFREALLEQADLISKMPDGLAKIAKANEVFGKSGLALIPILNQGRQGLEEVLERGELLTGVSERQALTMERNNEVWKEFKTIMASVAATIAEGSLPALTKIFAVATEGLVKLRSDIEAFQRWWEGKGGKEGLLAGSGAMRGINGKDIKPNDDSEFLSQEAYDAKKKEYELSLKESQLLERVAKSDYNLTAEERQKEINTALATQIELLNKIETLNFRLQKSGGITKEQREGLDADSDAKIQGLKEKQSPTGMNEAIKDLRLYFQELGTLGHQIGEQLKGTFSTVFSSVSSNITAVIMRTQSWGTALRNIGTAIMTQVVQSIVQMGVQFLVTHVLMRGAMYLTAAIAEALGAKEEAASIRKFALSSLAGLGKSGEQGGWVGLLIYLGVLAAGIGAVMAMTARESGGPVNAGQSYIVGERRPELFVPSQSGYIFPTVSSAPSVGSNGGGEGGGTSVQNSISIKVHHWNDEAAMRRHIKEDPETHHVLIDKMRREGHLIGARA